MTPSYPPPSRQSLEADLALARQNGDFAAEAQCLIALGDMASHNREINLAQGLYGQAWALHRQRNDLEGEARVLILLHNLNRNSSSTDPAFIGPLLEAEALRIYEAAGNTRGQADIWASLGYDLLYTERTLQETQIMQATLDKALALFQSIGNREGQGSIIAAYAYMEGITPENYQNAQQLFEQALTFYEEDSPSWGQAAILYQLGKIAALRGNHVVARHYLKASLAMYEHFPIFNEQGHFSERYEEIAEIALSFSDFDEARFYYENVLGTYYQWGWKTFEIGRIQQRLAHVEQEARNYDAAEQYLNQAFLSFGWHHNFSQQVIVLSHLAKYKAESGNFKASRRAYSKAVHFACKHYDFESRSGILWDWGQLEYQMGEKPRGCQLCRRAIDLMQRSKPHDESIKQWQQELAAMTCPTPPDSETSHDLYPPYP